MELREESRVRIAPLETFTFRVDLIRTEAFPREMTSWTDIESVCEARRLRSHLVLNVISRLLERDNSAVLHSTAISFFASQKLGQKNRS